MPTGPKGVINDWRRFKLESMDQENLPSAKKELLRQMSSPNKSKDDSRGSLNRKVPMAESHFDEKWDFHIFSTLNI